MEIWSTPGIWFSCLSSKNMFITLIVMNMQGNMHFQVYHFFMLRLDILSFMFLYKKCRINFHFVSVCKGIKLSPLRFETILSSTIVKILYAWLQKTYNVFVCNGCNLTDVFESILVSHKSFLTFPFRLICVNIELMM